MLFRSTGDLVAERLIAVFRDISRDIPIYSPQKGVLLRVGAEDRPIDGLNLIASVQRILGQPAAARLLQWARMRATGESIRSFCLESGRNRSIFYYWRKRMLEKVAAFIERGTGRLGRRSDYSPETGLSIVIRVIEGGALPQCGGAPGTC